MLTLIAQAANFGNQGLAPATGYGANISNTNVGLTIESLISNIISFITVVAGVVFIFFFLIGCINWITSGGDSSKVASARNRIVQGIIGLIVLTVSYTLIALIGNVIGIDILNLNQTLMKLAPSSSQTQTAPRPGQNVPTP